jgi:excisionase family DNA binding protein
MNEHEGLLSIREAAKRLNVGNYTIKKLIRQRALRAFKVGYYVRIAPLDLRRYLQRHEIAEADSSHNDDRRVG